MNPVEELGVDHMVIKVATDSENEEKVIYIENNDHMDNNIESDEAEDQHVPQLQLQDQQQLREYQQLVDAVFFIEQAADIISRTRRYLLREFYSSPGYG